MGRKKKQKRTEFFKASKPRCVACGGSLQRAVKVRIRKPIAFLGLAAAQQAQYNANVARSIGVAK
jgi:hypothetical protein